MDLRGVCLWVVIESPGDIVAIKLVNTTRGQATGERLAVYVWVYQKERFLRFPSNDTVCSLMSIYSSPSFRSSCTSVFATDSYQRAESSL